MKNLKTGFFTLCLLASSMAFAQEYEDFDMDRNDRVDRNEFNRGYANSQNQWDANRDGNVNEREFYDTTYRRMDTNRDNNLSENEWDMGSDYMYGEHVNALDYTRFDTNRDNMLSNDEFRTGFQNRNDSSFYNSYDENMDGNINRDELNRSVFNNWDRNRDGSLDRREYGTYRANFMDNPYGTAMNPTNTTNNSRR